MIHSSCIFQFPSKRRYRISKITICLVMYSLGAVALPICRHIVGRESGPTTGLRALGSQHWAPSSGLPALDSQHWAGLEGGLASIHSVESKRSGVQFDRHFCRPRTQLKLVSYYFLSSYVFFFRWRDQFKYGYIICLWVKNQGFITNRKQKREENLYRVSCFIKIWY